MGWTQTRKVQNLKICPRKKILFNEFLTALHNIWGAYYFLYVKRVSQPEQMVIFFHIHKDNSMNDNDNGNLVWIDLEMTGLNPDKDRILEVATVITNYNLDVLAEGPIIVLYQPKEVLDSMDSWNTKHHRHSGLFELAGKSTYDCRKAELETLDFISRWAKPQTSPMCGNSIGHDRVFLSRYMPEIERYFHYRNIDVSTIKELVKRWAPSLEYSSKKGLHRAYDDICESIAELKHYSTCFIKRS